MKKKILLLSAGVALLLSGCSDYVGKEKSHPLFIKAGKEKSAGEYKEAARCYEEFLLICPKSSRTHHELGTIYSDYLNDPLRAVYHYNKWMEMNPDDKTNYEDVRLLAETARKNLFKKLKEEYKESVEAKQSSEDIQKLKDQLAQAQNSLKQSEEQNREMKETLLKIKAEREKLNARTTARNQQTLSAAGKKTETAAAGKAQQGAASGTKAAAGKTAAAGAQGTYTVQPGDSLIKISRKCYGTPRYYHLIVEANRGKIKNNNQVRVGQVLVIPPKPQN